jgi:hypothetical protein
MRQTTALAQCMQLPLMAGVQVDENVASLLAGQRLAEGLVWSEQIERSYKRNP